MMSLPRPVNFSAGAMLAVVCIVSLAAGCTMCPDPYDYTGPVPNGSPPHNDFRARSNGIIPIGGAAKPWPPIVRSNPGRESTPEGDPVPVMVAEYGPAAVRDESTSDPAGTAAAGDIELPPEAVAPPLAEQDATGEPAAEAPAPVEIAAPAPPQPRRDSLPSLREASRWLRWR